MDMKRIIGWLLVASPGIALVAAMVIIEGALFALCVMGALAALIGIVVVGARMALS